MTPRDEAIKEQARGPWTHAEIVAYQEALRALTFPEELVEEGERG